MPPDHEPAALEAYLLGRVGFDALLAWQRRMVYEISGDRRRGILALCEFDPIITVGRTGSHQDIQIPSRDLATRGWPVKWVNRGGGTVLHTPGQLQIVAILPLDTLGLGLAAYMEQLHDAILGVAHESEIRAEVIPGKSGVWARGRLIAPVGVAVHDWVAYFGASLNIDCDLEHYRDVRCEGHGLPMTSLERERHGPVRPGFVRQLVVEAIAERFGFPRTSIFHHHPALTPAAVRADYFSRSA